MRKAFILVSFAVHGSCAVPKYYEKERNSLIPTGKPVGLSDNPE